MTWVWLMRWSGIPLISKGARILPVFSNTKRFREGMTAAGFDIRPGDHPIVPIMLGDARLAMQMADAMLAEGIYVVGFSFPVVPRGEARIRTQISAGHSTEQIDQAIAAFTKVGRDLGVLSGAAS